MPQRTSRALIALNAALLAVLGVVVLAPRADAQRAGGRPRGEYIMVAGEFVGGSAAAIYVMDTVNQEMVAVEWDNGQRGLAAIGYRDLAADSQAAPGAR